MREILTLIIPAALLWAAAPVFAQKTFSTADEAAHALVTAYEHQDTGAMLGILGPAGKDLVASGDKAQDTYSREQFVKMAKESVKVVTDPAAYDQWVIEVGPENWPLPIPLIKAKNGFQFDAARARVEILARRIGANELNTIATLRDFAQAEHEYATVDRNGDGLRDYAQRIISSSGKHDGMYWDAKPGEPESPLAAVVGKAATEGYKLGAAGKQPIYHGYVFRILKAQGPDAPDGAHDYMVRNFLLGGFGFVAYPAEYAVSGVKTFLVCHDGVVWEKDLGAKTAAIASAMTKYNPDKTWEQAPEATPNE